MTSLTVVCDKNHLLHVVRKCFSRDIISRRVRTTYITSHASPFVNTHEEVAQSANKFQLNSSARGEARNMQIDYSLYFRGRDDRQTEIMWTEAKMRTLLIRWHHHRRSKRCQTHKVYMEFLFWLGLRILIYRRERAKWKKFFVSFRKNMTITNSSFLSISCCDTSRFSQRRLVLSRRANNSNRMKLINSYYRAGFVTVFNVHRAIVWVLKRLDFSWTQSRNYFGN